MKKLLITGFAFILLFAVFQACNEPLVEEQTSDELSLKSANPANQSYIVVLNDSELNDELSKLKGYERKHEAVKAASLKILNRAGIAGGVVEHVYGTALQGFSVMIPPGLVKNLQDDPSVKYIEEDQIVTLIEPSGKPGSGITSEGEEVPWGITRIGGGTVSYSGSGRAWIIDTGIDLDNPDLNVDDALGVSFVRGVTSPNDDNGHGSHVSGTVAAKLDGNGVVGVAPGATVVPVKVLDKRGSGWISWVIAGVDYVGAHASIEDVDVANMSLGGGVSTSLDNAVLNASSVCRFALAAGNESDNANNHSPARVNNDSRIFTISAMGQGDVWASFSNYGNPPIDFCAPGVGVKSYNNVGTIESWNGTSMATPHVTGILLLQSSPSTNGYVNGDPDGNPDPVAHIGNAPPPANVPPTANFDFTTNNLTVTFTDLSSDTDGTISTWNWNFGDGGTSTATNPGHTYAAADTYPVTLTVTDDDGATGTVTNYVTVTQSPAGNIILTAVITGSKVKKASLTWTGATGANVEIYKGGSFLTTTPNTGTYSENLGKITSGSFEYQIKDEAGIWSNTATATVN